MVRAPVEGERCAGAVEDREVAEREPCPVALHRQGELRPDPVVPGLQLPRQATSVGYAHRRGAADRDDAGPLREQDADLRLAFLPIFVPG